MCAVKTITEDQEKPGLIWSVFANKCPRCRRGRLFTSKNPFDFRTTMRMPEKCAVCGQPFELQTGFYFGTGYVSYFLVVLIIIISFIAWYFTIGFSLNDNRIFWWLGIISALLIIFQVVIQRLCRSIWIALFVHYDPQWATRPPVIKY